MSAYLAEKSINGICAAPMSVPQVELVAQTAGLAISQFKLLRGHVLAVPYLSLHFIGYRTLGYTGKVNSGLPAVYVGIYYQANLAVGTYSPASPILYVGADAPGVYQLKTNTSMVLSAPGIYSVVLVNNHASSNIAALVTGAGQIFNVTTDHA